MEPQYFQDRIPHNHCYGCGPANAHGLRLKSYWQDNTALAVFVPQPYHAAGPQQFLNGGIIATIIDCHCICTAIADCYRRERRAIGSEPDIWCVTASLKVDYLQPTPIDKPVTLRAQIAESGPKKIWLECSVLSAAEECVRAEVLAIRVPASWRG
ncbi:MAG TPA: PaaI family thioesterase [Gammaproteobacteria bacterium]